MKLLTTLTLIFIMAACGDDRTIIEQGTPGPQGAQGPAGQDGKDLAETQPETLAIVASRDYDPSVFNPTTEELGAAVIQLPENLPANGPVGTGWASISINDARYCYQGDGKNNSDAGSQFEYVGLATGSECFMGTTSADLLVVEYFEDVDLTVAVHGGGVSASIRGFVEVTAEITVREF